MIAIQRSSRLVPATSSEYVVANGGASVASRAA